MTSEIALRGYSRDEEKTPNSTENEFWKKNCVINRRSHKQLVVFIKVSVTCSSEFLFHLFHIFIPNSFKVGCPSA